MPLIIIFSPYGRVQSYHEGYITPESLRYYLSDAELFRTAKSLYDAQNWNEAGFNFRMN